MKANVINIGNSAGIIIPKIMMESLGLLPHDEVEVTLNKNNIEIKPAMKTRVGWEEAARKCHEEKDDSLIIPDVFEDEGLEESIW